MKKFEVERVLVTSAAALMMAGWIYYWMKKCLQENKKEINETKNLVPISMYRNDSRNMFVIRAKEEFDSVMQMLKNDLRKFKVLGIDCEWCTREKKARPVAMMQLATNTGLCVLVRLNIIKNKADMPKEFLEILADNSIYKVGVGVMGDVKRLMKDFSITIRGIVDLRYLAQRHRAIEQRIHGGGLKELCEVVLGIEMNKSYHLKCSNWEAEYLKPEQMLYAANDALVAVDIFQTIIEIKLKHEVASLSSTEKWNRIVVQCKGLVDCDFKGKFSSPKKKQDSKFTSSPKFKTSTKPPGKMYRARKEPLYHNCRLEAPDGKQLCTVDLKKAEWYVRKGIGKVVCEEEPFTVRLNFVPAGIPGSEREYYLQDKENICVVCGRGDMYMRKYIVPHEYRRHFPKKMRHHSSHDVLLLCIDCHLESWNHDQFLRRQLADECDADFDKNNSEYVDDQTRVKVRSAAKALLRNRDTIPEDRVRILESTVKNFHNMENLDTEVLKKTSSIDTKIINDEFTGSHGKKVVKEKSKEEGGLIEFEKRWRRHFVNTMNPQHLPALWSVNYRHPFLEDESSST